MPRGRARQNTRRWRRLEWDEVREGIQERQPQQDPEPFVVIEPDQPEIQVVQCVAEPVQPVQVLYAEVQQAVRPRVVQQVREVRSREDIAKIQRLEADLDKLKKVTKEKYKELGECRKKVAKGEAYQECAEIINQLAKTLWDLPINAREYYVAVPLYHEKEHMTGVPSIKDKTSQKYLGKNGEFQLHIPTDIWFRIPSSIKVTLLMGNGGLVEELNRFPTKFAQLLHRLVFNDAKVLTQLLVKIGMEHRSFEDLVNWLAEDTDIPLMEAQPIEMSEEVMSRSADTSALEKVIEMDKWDNAKRHLFEWLDER